MPIIEKPENIVSNKIYIPTREVVEITLRVPYFDGNTYVLISIALLRWFFEKLRQVLRL